MPLMRKEEMRVSVPTNMMLKAIIKMARRDRRSTITMKMKTVSMFHSPTTNTCMSIAY